MAAPMNTAKVDDSSNLRVFKALSILTAPASSSNPFLEGASEELVDSVLQANLTAFGQYVVSSEQLQDDLGKYSDLLLQDVKESFLDNQVISVRKKVSEICICLLHKLCKNLLLAVSEQDERTRDEAVSTLSTSSGSNSVPELSSDVLSMQQERTVSSALQFIVVFGLSPYLTPGVGVPITQRLGPGQILLATVDDFGKELTDLQRVQYLLPVSKLFCTMLTVPSLQTIIMNTYLADVLTSLIQLRYCTRVVLQKNSLGRESSQLVTQGNEHNLPYKVNVPLKEGPSAQSSGKPMSSSCKNSSLPISSSEMEHISNVYSSSEVPDMYRDENGQPWTLPDVTMYTNREIDMVLRSSSVADVLTVLMMLSGGAKSKSGVPVKTPVWFRKTVAIMLRDVIMVPPGVQQLVTLFIGDESSSNISAQDWQKCKALAQVISHCPVMPNNIEKFYSSVSQQLIQLIQPSTKVSPLIVRAVGGAIQELTNQQPDLMYRLCLSHLVEPLKQLSSAATDSHQGNRGKLVLSEDILTPCIECLHKLFVLGQEPQSTLNIRLQEVLGVLFSLFVFTRPGISSLKSLCIGLLQTYLKQCDTSEAVTCLMSLLHTDSKNPQSQQYPTLHTSTMFESGPAGGVQAVLCGEKSDDMNSWIQPVDGLTDILSDLSSDSVTSQLFIHLLQKLTDIVTSEAAEPDVVLPSRVLSSAQQTVTMTELREKISLVSLLAALGEKFGAQVIHTGQHVLAFAKATLERCVKICGATDDDVTRSFEWETVSMAMGLLTAVLGGAVELTEDDKKQLDQLLPLLTTISESDAADTTVKEMADDLKVAVATRGLVWAELSKMKSAASKQETSKTSKKKPGSSTPGKPLIQVLSETTIEENPVEPSDPVQETKREAPTKPVSEAKKAGGKLEQAFQELCDPLLPVRGHGLISLARMLEERDVEVKDKQDVLLKVFMENLTHTDSYIYLAAVNGLAALSDLCPDHVIPCLCTEFRSKCTKCQSSKSEETTLKVGEALVKATRLLGELTPKYGDILLPAILCGCRHGDALVRASSLSGLADVCKLLRFSVGPILHEVFTCCKDVLNSDPHPEPRKAAAMTLALLIQGLGKDTLVALSDVLLDIYRVLKHSITFDPDEKVKFHANLALGELDDIMRDALFAKPELKKTITILGYQ